MPPGPASGFATANWPGAPAQPANALAGAGYPGQPAPMPKWNHAPQRGRVGSRTRTAIAAALTIAVAAGVTVPLLLSSGKSGTTKAFERSLLTPATVSAVANETFVIDTSKDDGEGDDTSSGCMDSMNTLTDGKTRGDASTSLVSADNTSFVAEDLSNDTNNAQDLNLLRDTLKTCHSATFGDMNVALQLLPQPIATGSDDSLAFQMTADAAGRSMVFDFDVARYGDNVVMVMYATVDSTIDVPTLTNSLLTEAVGTARTALPKA